ncbi:MAG: amidohydrolase family protein [Chloroflexi bacterium]|nr:amidohydrolase family protein [Chloroflexota bacterium]
MKIDIFTHIIPPKYKEALLRRADQRFYTENWDKVIAGTPALTDIDNRFRVLEKYEGLSQVLTVASPALEETASPENAEYLAQLANDELAELTLKYPDQFAAAVACLPMNDIEAALKEADRAINYLKFKGVQLYTPTGGKALDSPELLHLYQKMAQYDLPIWIHPARGRAVPDYRSESHSRYYIYQMFGWPYETTAAMVRLVFSGVFDKFPGIKFITHHCGAMIPFFSERLVIGQDYAEANLKAKWKQSLNKPPIDYFRMFYADTALNGNAAALACGYAFFGPERTVFATDFPYDNENGERFTREVIKAVESLDIPQPDKDMVFEGNARRLLHLDK